MKKFTLFFITLSFLFISSLNAQKQTIKFNNNWGKAGYNIVSQKSSGLEIVYSINEFTISDNEIKGEILQNISLPGIYLFNDAGMPDLPGNGKYIAIPEGSEAVLTVKEFKTEKYQNINMAPAPIIPFDTEKEMKYQKNEKVFLENKFYPENPFQLSEIIELRGVDAVMLGVTPFQYNPVTKELVVYRDIKFDIEFKGGSGQFGNNRLRSRWWDPILDDALLNYSSLPKINYSQKENNSKDNEFEYVILTLDNPTFVQWADSIAEFRRKQGISTGIFTIADVPGGNTVSSIEAWVDNMYNTWATPPAAVLILADYGTGTDGITSQSYPHPYSGTYISDNHYADVDNDDLPDIAFARMTANDASQLEVMISKGLNYERTPPTSFDFYNHPISALGWQTERWFQICSEVIGGYWKNGLGKDPVRINAVYDGNPNSDPWSTATNTSTVTDYFGPSGLGYIPATPSELGGFSGGTATDVTNAINNGSFMLQHRDHGGETGWGEPAYSNSNIDGLNNTDLTFIMSINCLTGMFDNGSEVFAEKFHRHTSGGSNSGALGIIAATQVSYSFVNDTYVWGAYDNMWPDFMPAETANPESRMIMPAFANVAGKNFLQQSSWPYNPDSKQITYRLFHHHGDAFLNVYSEVPQAMTVTAADVHVFGNPQYNVTVEDGAFISLTYYDAVNEETIIVATAESSGGITSLDMTSCPTVGTNLLLTITKQNYFRYTKDVLVISPAGPYVIADGFTINDGGNNEAEFGESFNLDLILKNVGSDPSQNITATLTTSDPYVQSLTNATTVSYSDLVPDASETSSGQFSVQLTNDVPDQHTVIFDLAIFDNSSKATYNSNISFKVNAPTLSIGGLTIDDAAGNADGILDPGETANIIIETTNEGHADITNVIGAISSSSSDLTLNSVTTSPVSLIISETKSFSFNVTANSGTPLGTPAYIDYTVTAGASNQYSENETKEVIIGLIPEFNISDGASITTCVGLFYDSGGESGSYSNNEDYTVTIYPTGTNKMIEVLFTEFDIEYNSSCGWDDLKIYDGISASATLIGEYCGTDSPGTVTATNDDGALTFVFHSDGSVTETGWVAEITCNITESPEGVLSGVNSNICVGSSSGIMTLSNYTATITSWEKRLDGGSWTTISNIANTYSETISVAGTWEYRAVLDGGTYYSNEVAIIVNDATVGGSVTGGTTICEGEATGTLTLSGHIGSITKWQKQLNSGSWTDISNNSTNYTETPTEDGIWSYRAVVKSGVCAEENSSSTDIIVNPVAVSGTVSATNLQICTGSSANLSLTGYEGNIQWQESSDGTNWTDISGATFETYTSEALTENKFFCAVISLGSCNDALTNEVEIVVVENPVAGYTFEADNQTLTFTNTSSEATSYSWDFGDTNSSTDENPVHVYDASGTYTVELSAINGICSDDIFSEQITVTYVNVSQLNSKDVDIFPNPTKGIFYISLNEFDKANVTVVDLNGKVIYEEQINNKLSQIDLSKNSKGVYFIQINFGENIYTTKIMIK